MPIPTSYKVVHQHCDSIIVEAEFENFSEAAACLANSIFMDPFIILDRDGIDVGAISPEEARKFAIESIEFRHGRGDS